VADLFKLQDEVVARLARNLHFELIRAEAEKGGHLKNPDAVDLTLRCVNLFVNCHTESRDCIRPTRGFFDRELRIDPNHGIALAGSAETYLHDWFNGWGDPGTDYDAKIRGQPIERSISRPTIHICTTKKAEYLSLSGRHREGLDTVDAGLAVNSNRVLLYTPHALAENNRFLAGALD
jgi:hypothetical protein